MTGRIVFLGGMFAALLLAAVQPVSADDCFAYTAYGDCYIELTGCDGNCTFDPGQNGEGSLTGENCTGFSGACIGNWYFELFECPDPPPGAPFYCKISVFGIRN